MKVSQILAVVLALISLSLPACDMHKKEQSEQEHHKIVVTSPKAKDVTITQQFVCQIRSRRNIDVNALSTGYLMEIPVKEGQTVKKGDLLFKILPTLYEAKLAVELAEVQLAQREYDNTERLVRDKVVSKNELALYQAKLEKAKANAKKAQAELNFTEVKAPFAGIVDRLLKQHGSLITEKDILTTLSDNSVMWVYFNVPEVRYYEYKALQGKKQDKALQGKKQDNSQLKLVDSRIELVLADGSTFNQAARDTVTIEGQFNNETGNIAFRADFPNPDRLLRHGQTGNLLIHRTLKNALVIPQRATFEILDRRYVYVIGKDGVVHQRLIVIQHEKDDIFVIKKGLDVNDRIVLEGVRQVHENDHPEEFEFRKPEEVLRNQKYHAE